MDGFEHGAEITMNVIVVKGELLRIDNEHRLFSPLTLTLSSSGRGDRYFAILRHPKKRSLLPSPFQGRSETGLGMRVR